MADLAQEIKFAQTALKLGYIDKKVYNQVVMYRKTHPSGKPIVTILLGKNLISREQSKEIFTQLGGAQKVAAKGQLPIGEIVAQAGLAESFTTQLQYHVVSEIGRGGMGSVYLAEQIGDAGFMKTVALKTILPKFTANREFLDMFLGEAKLTADLIHENILQLFSLGRFGDTYFMVLEYIPGLGVDSFIKAHIEKGFELPIEIGAFIGSRIGRGLNYAHKKQDRHGNPLNVVHRDVTPGNAIISFRGVTKVMDFGIAKALTTRTPDETEVLLGKLSYMSPEQARFEITDGRSDIYAAGLILYELLTGIQVNPNMNSPEELIEKIENRPIPDIREINAEVPEMLAKIVHKATQAKKEDRYQSGEKFYKDLEYYMYHDRYGPTNELLSDYLKNLTPDAKTNWHLYY